MNNVCVYKVLQNTNSVKVTSMADNTSGICEVMRTCLAYIGTSELDIYIYDELRIYRMRCIYLCAKKQLVV